MKLPNPRTTVWILAAILAAPTMIPTAGAQTQTANGDLVVDRIDVGEGVVDRPTVITIYVKNAGTTDFTAPAGGWVLKLGYKRPGDTTPPGCMDAETTPGSSSVCYQRFADPTSPMGRFVAGETKIVTVTWTPSRGDHAGLGSLYTTIQRSGCEVANAFGCTDPQGNPTGPDGNPSNNVQEHRIFLKSPAVRVVPLRTGPPDVANSGPNSAWRAQDVKEACLNAPEVTRVGCRAKPNQIVVFEYRVINEGNSGDAFLATFRDDDTTASNLTRRGYEYRFSENPVVIDAPGGEKVVRVEVSVPRAEREGNATNIPTVTARFSWASKLDPAQSSENVPTPPCTEDLRRQGLCSNPAFPSLLVGVSRDLNATTNDSFKQANVSELVEFNITLNNTGNSFDVYQLKLDRESSQINDSWNPRFDATVGVDAFSQKVTTVTLMPPANATKGIHTFKMTIQSTDDPEGVTLRTIEFHPDLQQRHGISGALDTQLIRVVPAKSAPFVLRLTNIGNGPDNVTLTAPQNVPFGWSAVLSSQRVTVPAFSTVPVYLNVTAPENTPADALAAIFVNATSEGPAEKPQELRPSWSFETRTLILPGSNIRITAPITSAYVDAGGAHQFDMVVRNTGNARDNFTLAVERDQSQLAWGATVTPPSLVLDPTQQAAVTVTLRAPGTAAVGETTKAFLTVTSTATKGTFEQLALEGRVSGPDLFVSAVVANATTPYSGDPLTVDVVLGNAGNKPPPANVTLKVYFVPQGGVARLIHEASFAGADLPGGRRLAERFTWDTNGVDGSGTLIARIDEGEEIAEIDESPASNEATRALTLRVFDIRLTPAQGLSGRPGEKVSYSEQPHAFLVEYLGNQAVEPVDIIIESEHGWVTLTYPVGLPRGTVIPVYVDVPIPPAPGVAKDTLRVTVVPSLRPTSTITASTVTTILDESPPAISGVAAVPAAAKLGQTIAIQARVTDATGLSSVRAFVVSPQNETESMLLTEGPSGTWSVSRAWPAVGVYRLYVEAVDGSEAQNKNTSRDTVVTFTVQPGSAPTIRLAEGQGTTIRSGTLVRFNVSDPLGVRSATYSVKGVSYDLPRPFALDTSSFQAGVYEINVTAENVYGVATSERFTLTVDNTPPGIRGVTLDPPRPKANQAVTVRVETDAKVSAVDVLVKRDGQVVETLAAVKKGSGVFEATLTPPEGEYALDVTAKDVAGNTNLEEGAVSFIARPGSPFDVPGPGLALVALAGVAAILLRRRR